MKLLLDTCTLIWLATAPKRVSDKAKQLFTDPDNDPFLSAVSCWEISLKYATGKLKLPEPPAQLVRAYRDQYRINAFPLDEESALYVPKLPRLHADPFDRMLICQSIIHGMAILTPDESITQYPVHTIW